MEKVEREKYWTDDDYHEPLIFDGQDLLFPTNIVDTLNRLEKEVQELREFKEKATPILKDLWFWETCPEGFKLTIEEITGENK